MIVYPRCWRSAFADSCPAQVSTPAADIRKSRFDEDRNLYVWIRGSVPKDRKAYAAVFDHPVVHPLRAVRRHLPAPGALVRPVGADVEPPASAKQFAVYACGGTQIRWLNVLSAPPPQPNPPAHTNTSTDLFATLPNLPGNTETARDLVLLAPIGGTLVNASTPTGQRVRSSGRIGHCLRNNLQWLDRYGAVKRASISTGLRRGEHVVQRGREPHGRVGLGCGDGLVITDAFSS